MKHLLWFCITLFLLSACTTSQTKTYRIPDLFIQDAGESAYLKRGGVTISTFGLLSDYSTFTKINDVEIPADLLVGGGPPPRLLLLEIPSGNHTVEILYEEEHWASIFSYVSTITTEKSRQTLTFTAEPNRIYAPFVTDKCSKAFFWIEDRGLYVAGSEKHGGSWKSDLTKPVVAGERPIKGSCEDVRFGPKEK